ncbi:MAG: hypothetical protein EA356_04930 [Geminicoccaceae bacterium]|nr:MAG: hypothetical protein EA356_04930 [Geminicoccaceae bacterium]
MADGTANRLYVEAIRGLAELQNVTDATLQLERLQAIRAKLDQILDAHPESEVAVRLVERLHPGAVDRLARLDDLEAALAARAALDDATIAALAAAAAQVQERIDTVPAMAALAACNDDPAIGCLRRAATFKLEELGLFAEDDLDLRATLQALDLVERVSRGDDLADLAMADDVWADALPVFTAIDLWSQVRGVDTLTPWRAVDPEVLPADLGGSLEPLLAFLREREEEADRDLREIEAAACVEAPDPRFSVLSPVLCAEAITAEALAAVWQGLPPYERLGVMEIFGQAVRVEGAQASWAAFLFGLDRPADLEPEEAPFLARLIVGGAVAWHLRP